MAGARPDQIFLPNKWVFPGGRVDRDDRSLTLGNPIGESEASLLLAEVRGDPSPRLPQALALAAIRETFEETGLVVGTPLEGTHDRCPDLWAPFMATASGLQRTCFAPSPAPSPARPARAATTRASSMPNGPPSLQRLAPPTVN